MFRECAGRVLQAVQNTLLTIAILLRNQSDAMAMAQFDVVEPPAQKPPRAKKRRKRSVR